MAVKIVVLVICKTNWFLVNFSKLSLFGLKASSTSLCLGTTPLNLPLAFSKVVCVYNRISFLGGAISPSF